MRDWEVASEKTYHSIGRFIYAFSQTEETIRDLVAQTVGLDEKYYSPIVGSYDVALLCKIAISVFKKSLPKYNVKKLEPLINKFLDMNQIRVRVVHGLWVPFIEGGTVHHTTRQKLKVSTSANQAESLEKNADEIFHLRAELERAFHEIPGNGEPIDPSEFEIED
jgi:hypothetical protein